MESNDEDGNYYYGDDFYEAHKDDYHVIEDYPNSFKLVCRDHEYKYAFVDENGNLLINQWFDDVGEFRDGFVPVRLRRKWNYIDANGNLLSRQWFDDADNFREGCAKVTLNSKINFINTNGDLILNQWFRWATDFCKGCAMVETLHGKLVYIDTQGNIIGYYKNEFSR
jgi:hypothetical protein